MTTATSLLKGLLKAKGLTLVLISSAVLLSGCGAGSATTSSTVDTAASAPAAGGTSGNTGTGTGGTTDNSGSTSGGSSIQAVAITSQPSNQMVTEGANVQMTVAASGTGPLSYQWYFNGQAVSNGTSATLSLSSVTTQSSGNYYCVVSNSGSSATSSTASLSVAAAVTTGSAQISWTAPTTRADGSSLTSTDISGYKLYESDTAGGTMSPVADLTSSETSVVVSDLAVGTHYFTMTTIDTNGMESAQSQAFSVTIN